MINLALMLAAFAAGATHVDPGQRSQPLHVDRGGLLQVEPAYFNLSAQTGGDFYFWAPGEFARAGLQLPIHDEQATCQGVWRWREFKKL